MSLTITKRKVIIVHAPCRMHVGTLLVPNHVPDMADGVATGFYVAPASTEPILLRFRVDNADVSGGVVVELDVVPR